MFYTISEMAKKFDMSPSTLRYYDKEGLFPFLERSNGGIRMFSDEDIQWLVIIDCLKQIGMPIKGIKEFINWCMEGDSTIKKRLNLIENQKNSVEKQIGDLKKMLHILEYKEWFYKTSEKLGTCNINNAPELKNIPEEFRDIAHLVTDKI